MGNQILLVDQDHAQLERLTFSLHDGGHRVQRVSSLAQAQAMTQETLPDLMLMEWTWPERQSMDILLALRADVRTRGLPIIVLSRQDDARSKIAALDAGADDYVVKPCDPGELHARIRAVLRRRSPQHGDDVVQAGGLRLDPLTLGVTAQTADGPRPISLSPLEFRLLHFLITHPQRVHSRTQLLDRVWGDHVFVGERTVDVHIRKLRVALAGTTSDGLIQTVRGGGYRLVAGSTPAPGSEQPSPHPSPRVSASPADTRHFVAAPARATPEPVRLNA